MAFNNRDEALDDLFDHIFGDGDVSEEDKGWFDQTFSSWFDKLEGTKPPGRRRQTASQPPAAPRRTRPGQSQGQQNKKTGGYGLSLFYGGKEDAG